MKITDFGPFGSALVAGFIPAGLLMALAAGFRIDMTSVVSVIMPGMALSVIMISVSMAWIFILIGRLKRQPRWIAGTAVADVVAMLELLGLVILLSRAG
jgi:hypothetical protein